jgi:hypothetical protein
LTKTPPENDPALTTGARPSNERCADEQRADERREAESSSSPARTSSTSHARTQTRAVILHVVSVVAFYSIVFTLFFSPVLFSTNILAPGDGFNFHAPFFYAGRTLWQPLLWGGYPLAADPQAMTWYPVALLFTLVPRGYDAFVVSAYVLASAFAYGYAYRLTRSTFASLAGGLVYGMCGFLVAQLGHVSLVHTAAFAPAVLWSLEELRRRASPLWFAASAASVACAGLAGHFQIFTYALGLALLYTLALGRLTDARGRRRIALMLSSLALGVAATAVQLVPTFELTEQGQRAQMSFAEFVSFSLPPRHLLRLVFPYAYGGSPGSFYATPYFDVWGPPVGGWGATELSVYVGVLPLMLAVVGLATHRRQRVAWFWACAALLALALSAGDALPLARVIFHLPAYNKFRVPARHLFELALAVGVLASLGVAAIERRLASARLIRRTVIACACVLALSLVALVALTNTLRDEASRAGVARLSFLPWHNPATLLPVVLFICAACALLFWSARAGSHARRALLLCVIVLDLASFGWFYEWRYTAPAAASLAPPAVASRYAQILRDAHQRMLPARGVLNTRAGLPPNVSALWRVPSAGGYSALILARTSRLLDMTNDGNVSSPWQDATNRSLDLFAVKYVFAPRDERTPTPAANVTAKDDSQKTRLTKSDSSRTDSSKSDSQENVSHVVAWDAADLGVALGAGCDASRPDAAEFALPAPASAGSAAFVTALACSASIKDNAPVLRVTAADDAGNSQTLTLRAGADTSEWAHDCADVLPSIAHRRARVFESFTTPRGTGQCEGHSYLARAQFEHPLKVKTLRLEWIGGHGSVDVKKITLLDEAGGRATPFHISDRAIDSTRWRRVEDVGGVTVYENLRARPRAWLAREVLSLPAEASLASIKTGRLPDGHAFDPARTALVEETSPLSSTTPDAAASASPATTGARDATGATDATGVAKSVSDEVSVSQSSNTALSVRVRADSDSFLVLSDIYFPGWRASLDGREAHVLQTDYALRGVFVPAGEHIVEFAYAPRSLRVGAAVTALAVVIIALVSLVLARRRQVHTTPKRDAD